MFLVVSRSDTYIAFDFARVFFCAQVKSHPRKIRRVKVNLSSPKVVKILRG